MPPSVTPQPGEDLSDKLKHPEPRAELIDKTKDCGPDVIGLPQWRMNQTAGKLKFTNGPQVEMTPQEWEKYVEEGKPKDWSVWLLARRAQVAQAAAMRAAKAQKLLG